MRPQKRIIQNSHLVQLGRCAWAAVGLAAGAVLRLAAAEVTVTSPPTHPQRRTRPQGRANPHAPRLGGDGSRGGNETGAPILD